MKKNMSKDILSFFPKEYTPSDIQAKVLTEIQMRWNNAEVFVLNLDVASGKSFIAHTIAEWRADVDKKASRGARICTPTTVLVDQYSKDFSTTPVAKSAQHYSCDTRRTRCGAYKAKDRCRGCVYTNAIDTARTSPISISTYHMNLVLKYKRSVMIFDEAHRISDATRSMSKKRIFPHRISMPQECLGDLGLAAEWAKTIDLEDLSVSEKAFLEAFIADIESDKPLNFYDWSTDWWSNGGVAWGQQLVRSESIELPTLNAQPLDIFTKPPIFWKPNQKLILMSATIGRPDLYELGLDKARPVFIVGDSPISSDRRPIIKDYIGTINHSNQESMLAPLASKIIEYCNTKSGKGVIHITYGLAKLLKPYLEHDRLITHGPSDMKIKLKEFLRSDNGVFLVSGMYEGVSLDYTKADWQAISKISWPSLVDPLQQHRAKEDQDYYLWSTLKTVIQTAGRVCRRPDDYGETFVWDASFERLLDGKHLVPSSFKERIL
jgi:Rad3-related DNA helicase